jgi:hypothetical protein
MRVVVDSVWHPMQAGFFERQEAIETEALSLLRQDRREEAIDYLTRYSNECGNTAVETAWKTADYLWTVFDGMW